MPIQRVFFYLIGGPLVAFKLWVGIFEGGGGDDISRILSNLPAAFDYVLGGCLLVIAALLGSGVYLLLKGGFTATGIEEQTAKKLAGIITTCTGLFRCFLL